MNIKITNKLLAGLILSWGIFSSCTSQDTSITSNQEGKVPLQVSSTHISAEITRAVLTSGAIGVFQTKITDGYSFVCNRKYAYTLDQWKTTEGDIMLNKNNAALCAYVPYNIAITDFKAIPLSAGKFTDEGGQLAYATLMADPVNMFHNVVNFNMEHAYSRISLKIKRGTYSGTGAISDITIKGNGIYSSANLNIASGIYTDLVSGEVSYNPEISSIGNSGDVIETGFQVIPSESFSNGIYFSFIVDGYHLSANSSFTKLEAGVNYVVTVELNGTAVLPSISMTDWKVVPYDQEFESGVSV